MARRDSRIGSSFFLALGFAALAGMVGCHAASPRPGALEMVIDSDAPYALVGRFHLTGLDGGVSQHVDFDRATSSVRIDLPAGSYTLRLESGARVGCSPLETSAQAETAAAPRRLTSAWPERIAIGPGQLTRATLKLEAPHHLAEAGDAAFPCQTSALATDALARR